MNAVAWVEPRDPTLPRTQRDRLMIAAACSCSHSGWKFPSVLEIASTQMTIFVKPRPYRRLTRSWCRWCCKRAAMQDLFKLRDGPLDWYFCDSEHALDWLEHRHSSVEANRLLRMLPDERARALNGRTIEEVTARCE